MRILARYLVKEMVMPMLFGVCAFTSLFVSGDLIDLANMVMQKGAPIAAALQVFLLGLPQIVVWTFPMAVLLATLLSLSRLSANSEIVAMRAGGLSFTNLVVPLMGVALVVSLLTFTIQELFVPAANTKSHRIMVQEIQGGKLPTVTNHVVIRHYERGQLSWSLYARSYDGKTQTLQHATIMRMNNNRPNQTTYAERIVWENDAWYMENGITYFLAGDSAYSMQFGSSRQPINLGQRPEEIAAAQKDPEQMSLAELREHIGVMRSQGAEVKELEVKMHLKYAIPFASLVFALIGVPLGIQPHRSSGSIGFGLSIIIIFIYYVLMTLGTALGQGGHMPSWLGAWIQNIIISAVGLYLMRRAAR
ncbi:MAG TPA: YjgP/YjgQ family permease [Firmicutes bacterium]|jgi:lipopolysaccharide export system permease protein|nr:YjgP/YjgQ family permease [Bacillota bacterium]